MDLEEICPEGYRDRIARLTENDVAVFDHVRNLPTGENIRSEAYVALLCLGGKATCRVGDHEFEVRENDVFLTHPRQFVENAMASIDFKCCGLLMSPEYFEGIFMLDGNLLDTKMAIYRHPVIHLEAEEAEGMCRELEFLAFKLQSPPQAHRREVLQLLMQTMVFEFYDCVAPKIPFDTYTYTSAEMLFRRFMSMAVAETPREREVKHYADQLCVTPKYLSAVCKQQSGNTASAILNRLTTDHIKRELRTSTKTVKEIAAETGFDNLSFFGKYVRRELGVSPREYRTQERTPRIQQENIQCERAENEKNA